MHYGLQPMGTTRFAASSYPYAALKRCCPCLFPRAAPATLPLPCAAASPSPSGAAPSLRCRLAVTLGRHPLLAPPPRRHFLAPLPRRHPPPPPPPSPPHPAGVAPSPECPRHCTSCHRGSSLKHDLSPSPLLFFLVLFFCFTSTVKSRINAAD